MSDARLVVTPAEGSHYRLGRTLRFGAILAVALALSGTAGQAGEELKGELVMVGARDSERIERVEFNYDGQSFNVARSRRTHDLRGSGNVQSLPGRPRRQNDTLSRRQIRRATSDASGIFSVSGADAGAVLRIGLENWEDVPRQSGRAEFPRMGGALSGDDRSLSHVALESDGGAYYFGRDAEAGGTFGVIDLETNTTTRLLGGLPPAADVADDPRTGEMIVIGREEIAQIQPRPQARIVSRHDLAPGAALESGAVDGNGHLFVRRADGEIVFIDYSASGRIGAAGNFTAAARVGQPAADDAPIAAREGAGASSPSRLAIAVGLAALLALIAVFLAWRMRLAGRARAVGQAANEKPGGGCEEIVYSRWPEDWSQLKRLIACMSALERAELGGRIGKNPPWLGDARALIRLPVRGGMSELRGGAAFGAALAGFARGETRTEWRAREEAGREIKITHRLKPNATEDWSRVIVEASVKGALGAGAMERALALNDAAGERGLAVAEEGKRVETARRSAEKIAAESGPIDIRRLFDGVARRLVEDGAATRLELDAAAGLSMPGKADELNGVLEDLLRSVLASARRDGAAPPSLAVTAHEEKGEIRFIARRAEPAGRAEGAAPVTDAAPKQAQDAAGRSDGRVWIERGGGDPICRFTLSGKARNFVQRLSGKRSGWRPAQPKAVWSMRPRGDVSRF